MRIFRGWLAAGLMLVSGAFAAPLLPPAQEVLRIAPATFAAARAFPAAETALMLTGLQQALAAQGVVSPTGWQIGIALLGGTLVTPEGSARMPAIIAPDPRKPMVCRCTPSPARLRTTGAC